MDLKRVQRVHNFHKDSTTRTKGLYRAQTAYNERSGSTAWVNGPQRAKTGLKIFAWGLKAKPLFIHAML